MLVVITAICFYWRRRRNNGSQLISNEYSLKFQYLTPDDLRHATDQFAELNRLGFGGTVTVYKGKR
jgi:hypothetical protein